MRAVPDPGRAECPDGVLGLAFGRDRLRPPVGFLHPRRHQCQQKAVVASGSSIEGHALGQGEDLHRWQVGGMRLDPIGLVFGPRVLGLPAGQGDRKLEDGLVDTAPDRSARRPALARGR